MDYGKIKKRKLRYIKTLLLRLIPDKLYIDFMFKKILGHKMNWKNPKTFSEKQNWMKLYYRPTEFTQMVDKLEAKKLVASMIGDEYVIPLLGSWDRYEDIDFDALPDSFVLKPNNGCGDFLICKNKEEKNNIDHDYYKALFDINMKTDYSLLSREWQYRGIKPKILAEKYMTNDEDIEELSDYKFMCFHGEPKIMFIATERNTDCKFDFYDMEFNHLDLYNLHPNSDKTIEKPKNYDKLIELAKILSKDYPFVRIDFFISKDKIYFSEWTISHSGGFSVFKPDEWEYKLGDWIHLEKL